MLETDVLDGAIDEAMRNVPRVPDIAEDEQLSDDALESLFSCRGSGLPNWAGSGLPN